MRFGGALITPTQNRTLELDVRQLDTRGTQFVLIESSTVLITAMNVFIEQNKKVI